MSRTTRRNHNNAAWHYYGGFDHYSGFVWMEDAAERKRMTLREMYDLDVRRYHLDRTGEGRRKPPRWFRNMYGSEWVRRRNRDQLICHLRDDSFDNHMPEPFKGRAGFRIYL